MQRYTMFLDLKNLPCENDYTIQSNLQIQCNPYQTINRIFHRARTKNSQFVWKHKKIPNSQSKLEEEKRSWRNQASGLQTILQSYSNQDSMVLAHMVNLFLIKEERIYNGEKTASSVSGAGKTGQLHVKE